VIASRALLLAGAATVLVVIAACDPVHSDAINALGDNAPGVRNGPLHRPGEPCLLCHDGAFTDPRGFSVAGTIYLTQASNQPAVNATVEMTDKNGSVHTEQTNEAGNFYVMQQDWTPTYPLHVTVTSNGVKAVMQTRVGRDGSCAGCHVDPVGPGSPGHVSVTDPIAPVDAGAEGGP
jgi:hypothetical protein